MTKTRVLTLIVLISLICLAACKKKPEKIGNDLQPSNSLITVMFDDEQDVVSSTFTVPYLNSKMLTNTLLGNINDPIFGNANYDFYTQFSLSTSSQTWGNGAVADSVVLNLCFNGYYGDTLQPLNVRVYEIAEEMYPDSTYRSNMTLECDETELANYTFIPRPLTPVDTILDRGVVRIPIDVALGTKFIENEADMTSNDAFKEFFKGLHVACDFSTADEGSICFFNMTHSYTYLRVYYHNDNDTLSYDFGVANEDVRYNHYSHDFNTAENPITFNDTVNNEKLYVQGTAGTRVWLKFPNLQEWANSLEGNLAINEAKLVLTGAVTDTADYAPPARLVVTGAKFDTDTTYVILPDQYVGSEYIGGEYNASDGTVWFRITEYVQNVIKNGSYATNCNGLLIYVDQGATVARRWAFYGPQGETPVKLELVYSLIND